MGKEGSSQHAPLSPAELFLHPDLTKTQLGNNKCVLSELMLFSVFLSFSLIHINSMFVWLRFSGTETFKLK